MERILPVNPGKTTGDKNETRKEIWLAGGCFWGVEAYFSRVRGVVATTAGYANGETENPTYEEVCSGTTGHAETVHVVYDPEVISLAQLLQYFFQIIDPTARNRQGNDVGSQYRSGVYYRDPEDLPVIRSVFAEVQKGYQKPVVTEVLPLANSTRPRSTTRNTWRKTRAPIATWTSAWPPVTSPLLPVTGSLRRRRLGKAHRPAV